MSPRRVLGAAPRRGPRADPPAHRPRPQPHGPAGRAARRVGARRAVRPRADRRPARRSGPTRASRSRVGDVDSLGLARLIAAINDGRLAAGEPLEHPDRLPDRRSRQPAVDPLERLAGKLDAGVGLLQSNIVYDVERFAAWLAPLVDGRRRRARPAARRRHAAAQPPDAEYMHDRIPGVEVDDATFAAHGRARTATTPRPTGIAIAAEHRSQRLREIPGVAGVHLMAPGWEGEAVPASSGPPGSGPPPRARRQPRAGCPPARPGARRGGSARAGARPRRCPWRD